MLPRKPRTVPAHTQRCESFRPTSVADSFQTRPSLKCPSHSCPDGRFAVRLRDPLLSVAAFSLPEVAPKCHVTLPESKAHRYRRQISPPPPHKFPFHQGGGIGFRTVAQTQGRKRTFESYPLRSLDHLGAQSRGVA